jgi:hypothetical protein
MIKWMPCTNGRTRLLHQFAEYDHRGYRATSSRSSELRGGELHFRGYYRPEWPSNARPTP